MPGIISGKGRGIDKVRRGKLLQTDAAINPGNSGGPLVNLEGQVVGINTAIASMSGGYQGIGFAIPIDRAKWITQELLTHGKVRRASLGISIEELTPEAAVKLKLPARSGVFVRDVLPGSPADAAGIKINDVIVEFAGQRTPGPRDLQDLVEQKADRLAATGQSHARRRCGFDVGDAAGTERGCPARAALENRVVYATISRFRLT